MPNCDFFAADDDHRAILAHLLERGECDIYESYSEYDLPLIQFRSLADFEQRFKIEDWNDPNRIEAIHLQLFPHSCGGSVHMRRISLNPVSCGGATFRYCAEGWGMVQLYLESPHDGWLRHSHTNHNSEARAKVWAPLRPEVGCPEDWDWKKVALFSRRLNRFIHSLVVERNFYCPLLRHADSLRRSGISLS